LVDLVDGIAVDDARDPIDVRSRRRAQRRRREQERRRDDPDPPHASSMSDSDTAV